MSTDTWCDTTEPDACRACGTGRFHTDAHSYLCSHCGAYHGPAMRPRYGYTYRAQVGARDAIEGALNAWARALYWIMAEADPYYGPTADLTEAAANHRLALASLDNATEAPPRCAPGRHWGTDRAPECCICGERLGP